MNPEVFKLAAEKYLWDGIGEFDDISKTRHCCVALIMAGCSLKLFKVADYCNFFKGLCRPAVVYDTLSWWHESQFDNDVSKLQAHRKDMLMKAYEEAKKL